MRKPEELPVYLEAFGVPEHLRGNLLEVGYVPHLYWLSISAFIAATMIGAIGGMLPVMFWTGTGPMQCSSSFGEIAALIALLACSCTGIIVGAYVFVRIISRASRRVQYANFNASFLNERSDAFTPTMVRLVLERDDPIVTADELVAASNALTLRWFGKALLVAIPFSLFSLLLMSLTC